MAELNLAGGKSIMDRILRILILEDCATDADLMEYELREASIDFVAQRVITEEDYRCALREFAPDLILSDYDLPQYNGSVALAEARSRCPDVPFILVTGILEEDLAAEILTKGAQDFVAKNQLYNLASAVRRVIAQKEPLGAEG
ncbi:MAG: response regulator [Syntrophales bacterium]